MDEYQKVVMKVEKSLTTEESLIELLILLGLSYKERVKIEIIQNNYQYEYENLFKPLIIDIDSLELEKEKISQLIGDVGRILANVQTPF